MKKYIDADLLKSDLQNINESERLYYIGVFDVINSQPAADVAEVVRCKDCKYWNNAEVDYKGASIKTYAGNCQCSRWDNEYYWYATTENDFCSYGERKEQG